MPAILEHRMMTPKPASASSWRIPPMTNASRPATSFNLLDARGVISVTERQAYIGRVRALAKACADAFVQTERGAAPHDGRGSNCWRLLVISFDRGCALYYLQVYAYYDEVRTGRGAIDVVVTGRPSRSRSTALRRSTRQLAHPLPRLLSPPT